MLQTRDVVNQIKENLAKKSHSEPEFLQAAEEVLDSLIPVVEKHPEYMDAGIL
jgi:glutamate dehydrogenase (NADP+)